MATKGASDRGQRKAEIYSLPKKSVDQTRRNKPSKYGVHPYIVGTHAAKNLILKVRLPIVEGKRQRMHAYKLVRADYRSEEHTSDLQSLMRISYAVLCLKIKTKYTQLSHISTLSA